LASGARRSDECAEALPCSNLLRAQWYADHA
jgi:hypothetical protein